LQTIRRRVFIPDENFVGLKYNLLTAVRPWKKKRYWVFNCDCGTQGFIALKRNIVTGHTKSCGCLPKGPVGVDITGNRYNYLVAIRWHSHATWLFRCDCGTEKPLRKTMVIHEKFKSCGCYASERGKEIARKYKSKKNGRFTKYQTHSESSRVGAEK
jgi:hypothetical protein